MCKKLAVCTAAFVAAASVGVCCRPVPVYASDFDIFLYEYQNSFNDMMSDSEFLQLIYSNGDYKLIYGWQSSFLGLLLNVTEGIDVTVPLTDMKIAYYRTTSTSEVYPCTITYPSGNLTPTFNSQHFNVHMEITATSYDVVFNATSVGYSNLNPGGYNLIDDSEYFVDYYSSAPYSAGFIPVNTTPIPILSRGSSAVYLEFGNNTTIDALPPGNIDSSAPWEYYNNVLIPAMRNVYPNIPSKYYVFPDGYSEPYTPIYPTGDYVTGIPKDWTVENPVLPTSPQMSIDVPDASLPDLSGLSQYTDGVGFWWSLTGWIMDTFGIREIVLLLIGLGVFAFLLYRLGAG